MSGLSYNRFGSNICALILRTPGGKRCLPIVIGAPEAQSIQCFLQNVRPMRPLTHDLTAGILKSCGISLTEVFIHRLDNGIFAAELTLGTGNGILRVDSRSSDAVALALRMDAPLFTSPELLEQAGFDPEGETADSPQPEVPGPGPEEDEGARIQILEKTVSSFSSGILHQMLQEAVASEKYRDAAIIQRELDRRKRTTG